MSTENLDKLLASGQTEGVSMIVTVPFDLWSKALDELEAIKALHRPIQPGRIYFYEPSEVEKLQRQVDDLIRVLARNAR